MALWKVAAFIAAISITACAKPDRWLGVVYPDKANLASHQVIGEYDTLNACLSAVNEAASDQGAYECAKNCDGSSMPMVCEETIGNEK